MINEKTDKLDFIKIWKEKKSASKYAIKKAKAHRLREITFK